jgi:hypothetical protein
LVASGFTGHGNPPIFGSRDSMELATSGFYSLTGIREIKIDYGQSNSNNGFQ